jgi:hypothetical protein
MDIRSRAVLHLRAGTCRSLRLASRTPSYISLLIEWDGFRPRDSHHSYYRILDTLIFVYYLYKVWATIYYEGVYSLRFGVLVRAYLTLAGFSILIAGCVRLTRSWLPLGDGVIAPYIEQCFELLRTWWRSEEDTDGQLQYGTSILRLEDTSEIQTLTE